MPRLLLDTTVLIDASRGFEPVTERLHRLIADGHEIGVSPITVAEFWAGVEPARRSRWEPFIRALQFWPITFEVALRAGEYRRDWLRRGRTLDVTDTLVAAVAYTQNAMLLTDNLKDFPMQDIVVQPVRGPAWPYP